MNKIRLAVILLSLLVSATVNAASVNYTLSFSQPQTHYVEVEMRVTDWKGGDLDLRLPVWAPGSYLVREFSRFVENVTARDKNGKSLSYTRSSKNGWKFNAPAGDVRIQYRVYAYELSVRTSFIDADHAYLNGTSVFMYVEDGKSWPCKVTVILPDMWKKISVALESTGKNTYAAADYDLLVDSPFEIGNHSVFNFNASGVEHEVAMFGEGSYDVKRLQEDMKKIVEECTSVYGKHPCKNYLFIIHNLTSGGGGLEHQNSTTLEVNRYTYSSEGSYNGFLSLVAHEYFHLWNVKRLRPVELGPFDYNNENYTTMLWFAEGFTAYYDDLIVRRCGFSSNDAYLGILSGNFSYVVNTPGNKVQSLEESSSDAWIKFYRTTENSSNNSISYYTKGAAVGAVYDLAIRSATGGNKSLDNVMQSLYDRYYVDNKGAKGITPDDFRKMVNEVAGVNLDTIYQKYVAGNDSIDYNTFLKVAGLKIVPSSAAGGAWTGMNFQGGKLIVSSIERGSPAWEYGMNVNDEIIAINKNRVTDDMSKFLAMKQPGEKVTFTVARGGVLRDVDVVLGKSPAVKFSIVQLSNSTEEQKKQLSAWLK